MSRNRGLDLQNGLARYLRQWWPGAESAGAGRPGSDVLGVVGVVWENKTADKFEPLAFVRQAQGHILNADHTRRPGHRLRDTPYDDEMDQAYCTEDETLCSPGRPCVCCHANDDVPVVVYWPRGVGEKSAGNTLSIVPTEVMVRLLKEAGY